jgi:carboxyl-terminal processing protease
VTLGGRTGEQDGVDVIKAQTGLQRSLRKSGGPGSTALRRGAAVRFVTRFVSTTIVALLATSVVTPTAVLAGSDAPPRSPAIERIAAMLEQIRARYVEPIDDEKLVADAINGVLRGLDPYSKYLDPDAYATLQQQNRGEYGGLGVQVRMEAGGARVVAAFEEAPASLAGLQPGDLITHIDGAGIAAMTLGQVTQLMRGRPDTPITLTVERDGQQQAEPLTLTRAVVRWPSVKGRMVDTDVALLTITNFHEHTGEMLAASVARLWRESEGAVNGIILDLRDNPGGLLNVAVGIAAAFLPPDVPVVSADGAGQGSRTQLYAAKADYLRGSSSDYLARMPSELRTLPMVVLVNGRSASSAEIVAGALQDHGRAQVLGTQTFGKGSIQRMYPQRDGSGLKLTTAFYYTPTGRRVQGEGITPDVIVERDPPAVAASAFAQPTMTAYGQVARADTRSDAVQCWPAGQDAGADRGEQSPDCQLGEALRLLRARTAVGDAKG